MAPDLNGLARFDLGKKRLNNNAVMINYLIYFHDLDNFSTSERMNHSDTRATMTQIIKLGKSDPDDPFYAVWQSDARRGAHRGQSTERASDRGGRRSSVSGGEVICARD